MEFDSEKQFLRLENSLPPHNFSNGPSLKFGEGDALRCRKILVACQNFEHWFTARTCCDVLLKHSPKVYFRQKRNFNS